MSCSRRARRGASSGATRTDSSALWTKEQERDSDGIAKAVKESALRHAVHLSSYGAQLAKGAGPVSGLHSSEQKLNAIDALNILHLRAAYFMENNLAAIGIIHGMEIFGNALLPDLKIPMAATGHNNLCSILRKGDGGSATDA